MQLLIIARLADILTTYLNVNKWGWDVEGNPLVRRIGESGYFMIYQFAVIVFLITALQFKPKWKKVVYKSLTVLSFLVATMNIITYLATEWIMRK
jgi:hypothetical protein